MLRDRFFALLRCGMSGGEEVEGASLFEGLSREDWLGLMSMAKGNGVKYLVFEGVARLPKEVRPPSDLYLKWYVDTENAEARFGRYVETLGRLSALFRENDIRLLVMKGYTFARLYPVPARREGGDIDAFLCGKFDEGDALFRRLNGEIKERPLVSHHSSFEFEGVTVENHKYIAAAEVGEYSKMRPYRMLEKIIQDSIKQEEVETVSVGEEEVRALNLNVAALHLIFHTLSHTVFENTSVRQYCDWKVFFDHYRDKLDRDWLRNSLLDFQFDRYVANVEAFLQENLGFEPYFSFTEQKIYEGKLSILNQVFLPSQFGVSYSHLSPVKHAWAFTKRLIDVQQKYGAYYQISSYNAYFLPHFLRKVKRYLGFKGER